MRGNPATLLHLTGLTVQTCAANIIHTRVFHHNLVETSLPDNRSCHYFPLMPLQQLPRSTHTASTSAQSERCRESTKWKWYRRSRSVPKRHFVLLLSIGTAQTRPGEPQQRSAVHRSVRQPNPSYSEMQIKCSAPFLSTDAASYQLLVVHPAAFFKQSWLCLWCYATLSKSTCLLASSDLEATGRELGHPSWKHIRAFYSKQ